MTASMTTTPASPADMTKIEPCPEWCVMDHYADPEQGADGYTCATGWAVLTLPASRYDNALMTRTDAHQIVRVRRAQFTVEDNDEGSRPGSTRETVELCVDDDFAPVGLNEEEARLLIELLGFHAGRLAASRALASQTQL